MSALSILGELADLITSWRLYVCIGPAIALAVFLHRIFPDALLLYWFTIPLVISSFVLGFRWQLSADRLS
jgi:ABC-type Fe3+ transport system permease subunit